MKSVAIGEPRGAMTIRVYTRNRGAYGLHRSTGALALIAACRHVRTMIKLQIGME